MVQRRPDRPPSDPTKLAEYEEANHKLAKTEADQDAAKRRLADEKKRKDAISEEDKLKIEKDRTDRERAERNYQKSQKEAREELLATPLSDKEWDLLDQLEEIAMAPGSPDPDAMRDLADLRVRSKIEVEEDTGDEGESGEEGKAEGGSNGESGQD